VIYVYKTTNTVNGKYYIGVHEGEIDDEYLGSGSYLNKALLKYGKDVFRKEILEICETREEAYALEKEIVNAKLVNDPSCYNVSIGGTGGWFWYNEQSTKKALENRRSFAERNPEKAKINADKTRERLKNVHALNLGRPMTEEAKRNLSNANKGKKQSDETKQKRSKSMTGRIISDETKAKLKVAAQNRHADTDETRIKKSKAAKKRIADGTQDMGLMRDKHYKKVECECGRFISINTLMKHKKKCNGEKYVEPTRKKCNYSIKMKYFTWYLQTPNGDELITDDILSICAIHDLSYVVFKQKVLKNDASPVTRGKSKGWCVIKRINLETK